VDDAPRGALSRLPGRGEQSRPLTKALAFSTLCIISTQLRIWITLAARHVTGLCLKTIERCTEKGSTWRTSLLTTASQARQRSRGGNPLSRKAHLPGLIYETDPVQRREQAYLLSAICYLQLTKR
jgi:hypothetical protein